MAIIPQIKKLFSTKEAQELKKEISESTKHLAEKVESTVKNIINKDEKKQAGSENCSPDVIEFETFMKIEVRVGTIESVEVVPKSEKLLKLQVNIGEAEPRQIISGIKNYFENPQILVGRQSMFVTNLAPRKIMGLESNGMIFAVNDTQHFSLLEPSEYIAPGTRAS